MGQKKIYILNGVATSGKDTFVDICNTLIDHVKHTSYIDLVRYHIAPYCGYEGGKTEKDRRFLAELNFLLEEYNDKPFKSIRQDVRNFYSVYRDDINTKKNAIMFIDIREPAVIERACKEFGAKSIFIENNRVEPITSNEADANVKNYDYDIYINNNGTLDDLRNEAIEFLKGEGFEIECN